MHMKNHDSAVFLLGGHDLEMMEIRRILESYKIAFFDNNLTWDTAHLSAYSNIFSEKPNAHYYGVELKEDCLKPLYYTRIDHHNDYSDREASILQVARLLEIEPDHRLELVAANDARYIPGMLELGASRCEIDVIRRQDRAAQGVSEEDERNAELSIARSLSIHGDLQVVYSLTPCFSPICDRLYPYRHLLIYTDDEWTFYGEGKSELVRSFSDMISQGKLYHGGGDKGYIGSCRGAFSVTEILEFVNIIKQRHEHV